MSSNLFENIDFLKSVAQAKRRKRQLLLALATRKQIQAIQEIANNIVNKNLPIPQHKVNAVLKGNYKKCIAAVGSSKGCVENKRKLLVQRGGFLPHVLPTAIKFVQNGKEI